jgi:hypothetical protein
VHVTAVGAGSALAESWDGRRWVLQPVPGGSGLSAVSCRGRDACMAVGGDDRPLAERWDGSAWSVQPVPSPRQATRVSLLSVSCPSSTVCVAAGRYVAPGNVEQPLILRWGGARWMIAPAPLPPGPGVLAGISCRLRSDCTAVGSFSRRGQQFSYAAHWDGTAWVTVPVPGPQRATAAELMAVACPGPAECIAVGSASTETGTAALAERWDGQQWSPQRIGGIPGQHAAPAALTAVSCPSPDQCTAVGWFLTGTGASRTLAAQWNGAGWSVLATPNPAGADAQLRAVSCVRGAGCTAVGDYVAGGVTVATLAEHGG